MLQLPHSFYGLSEHQRARCERDARDSACDSAEFRNLMAFERLIRELAQLRQAVVTATQKQS